MVGGGGGGKLLCPTIQTSVNFATLTNYIFASCQQISSKLGNFSYLKTFFFQGSRWIFPNFPVKGLKKPWKGLFSDLTVALKGYLTAVTHDSQNDGDK